MRNNVASDHLDLGLALLESDNIDEAIIEFNKAIDVEQDYADAYYYRGIGYSLLSDYESAIRDHTITIQLAPEHFKAYNNRGMDHKSKMDFDSAISDFNSAIIINPKYCLAITNRGIIFLEIGELDAAIRDFNEAIMIDNNNSNAYYYRGLAYKLKGNLECAIVDYNKSYRISRENNSEATIFGSNYVGMSEKISQNNYENYGNYSEQNNNKSEQLDFQKKVTNLDVLNQQEDLHTLFLELNSLIGLDRVKSEIRQLIHFVKIQDLRQKIGLGATNLSMHSVFYGSPGTGKTTVARIYGRMLRALGLLKVGHLVETDRAGLVGNYIGQTANKTDEKINQAIGGVLFIDEAYSLFKGEHAQWDYGSETIEILMKRMEDNRNNLAVIVAGYPDPMNNFLNSNEGFKSRFANNIHFDDYSIDELTQIFISFCNQNNYFLDKDAFELAKKIIEKDFVNKDKSFGNARYCRNIFEKIIRNQAFRIGETIQNPTKIQLRTITVQDVSLLLES